MPSIEAAIFDWKRTLYDPDTSSLLPNASQLLRSLTAHSVELYLIGRGDDAMRAEAQRLEVASFFTQMHFAPGEKNPDLFRTIIEKSSTTIATVIVGDRVRAEIEIGNQLGATTLHVCQGKFAAETPLNDFQRPDLTAQDLFEAQAILEVMLPKDT